MNFKAVIRVDHPSQENKKGQRINELMSKRKTFKISEEKKHQTRGKISEKQNSAR